MLAGTCTRASSVAIPGRGERNAEGNVETPGDGPSYVVMRLYWPKEEALTGKWQPPPVKRVK